MYGMQSQGKGFKRLECFYRNATFYLACVKSLAAETLSAAFDKIDRDEDVLLCIHCVHERTSEVLKVISGMLNAEHFAFEGVTLSWGSFCANEGGSCTNEGGRLHVVFIGMCW